MLKWRRSCNFPGLMNSSRINIGDWQDVSTLTTGIAKGNREAFAFFYETRFDRAFSMAKAATRRDESFCLDIVQDSMLRVIKAMRPMNNEKALAAWFARVVYTTAMDRLRQESRRLKREQCAVEMHARATLAIEIDERIVWLETQLAKLTGYEKKLIHERFTLNKTLEDVGNSLGITGYAAHGRIRRILLRLHSTAKDMFGNIV